MQGLTSNSFIRMIVRNIDLVHLLVYLSNMIVNIHDAKTNFSKYIVQALQGEEVIVAKNGEPLVKIVPLKQAEETRISGLSHGMVVLQDDFDAPLQNSILQEFEK